MEDYEKRALTYAEANGIIEYDVNGNLMEYWTFFGSYEGWYFVRVDLDSMKEVFRGANIPYDSGSKNPIPAFLMTSNGAARYNYMEG